MSYNRNVCIYRGVELVIVLSMYSLSSVHLGSALLWDELWNELGLIDGRYLLSPSLAPSHVKCYVNLCCKSQLWLGGRLQSHCL